jgi:hypothetical protein
VIKKGRVEITINLFRPVVDVHTGKVESYEIQK